MQDQELVDEQWLVAYEANIKKWLPNIGGVDFVASNKFFGPVKAAGVSFYDLLAMPAVTVKPELDADYADSSDFDLEAALVVSNSSEW